MVTTDYLAGHEQRVPDRYRRCADDTARDYSSVEERIMVQAMIGYSMAACTVIVIERDGAGDAVPCALPAGSLDRWLAGERIDPAAYTDVCWRDGDHSLRYDVVGTVLVERAGSIDPSRDHPEWVTMTGSEGFLFGARRWGVWIRRDWRLDDNEGGA